MDDPRRADIIQVDNVDKKFGDFLALGDTNLRVKEGEFVCLIGPSGCGKSTLLRIIAGFELASDGTTILSDHPTTSQVKIGVNYRFSGPGVIIAIY